MTHPKRIELANDRQLWNQKETAFAIELRQLEMEANGWMKGGKEERKTRI